MLTTQARVTVITMAFERSAYLGVPTECRPLVHRAPDDIRAAIGPGITADPA